MALRKVLRPFLKAVHPDVLHHHASATVKRTNEQSLQQLNTILDTLEHLGQGKPQNPQQYSLEPSYELTFHLMVRSSSGKTKAKSAAAASLPLAAPFSPTDTAVAAAAAAEAGTATSEAPHTFTARLTFPSTTITRYARAAPLSSSSAATNNTHLDTHTTPPTPILQLPPEISQQLRKLFQGARLKIPKELESTNSHTYTHTHSRHLRSNYITNNEANGLLLADLMTRDLRVDGPSHTQRQAAVSRLLRSGRVMTKGLSPPEEAVALRHLEEVLVGEWERGNLGDVSPSIQILLDADSERIHWEILSSPSSSSSSSSVAAEGGGGRGRGREMEVGGRGGRRHLLICPADVKGSRFRLASILRMIGRKEQEEEMLGGGGRAGGGGGATDSFFASSCASSERKQGEGRRQYRRAEATPSSSEGICVEPFSRRGKDLDVHVGRF